MYMLQLRHHFGTEIPSIHSVKILQPDKSEIKTGTTVNFTGSVQCIVQHPIIHSTSYTQ